MSKNSCRLLAAMLLCIVMSTGSAWAQARGHGRSSGRDVWSQNDRDHDGDRDARRGGRDHRSHAIIFGARDSGRPPGWDRGRKTGWGNCDVPPGQAKKYGCRSSIFSTRRTHRRYPSGVVIRRSPRTNYPVRGRDRDRDRD